MQRTRRTSGRGVTGRRQSRALVIGLSVAAAAGLFVLASCAPRAPEVRNASHVIFISIDTARADHFGFMGSRSVRTPQLDSLAGESIVFTDYMTVAPTTLASHTTLLTGMYPHHHGVARNGFLVNERNEMLTETLRDAGFRTAGFAGSFALESRFGFAQGFDHYDEEWELLVAPGGAEQNERLAEHVTDAALSYLDESGVPEHLFLFAHYFDPHAPYTAPAPYDTLYDPEGWSDLPPVASVRRAGVLKEEERLEYARRLELHYAAEITYTDAHIGRLLDGLRERGILDDALLVVTSDHGECLWEHGEEFDHGRTVYQATMHAICLMRLPRARLAGTRVEAVVASVDVAPTVLAFLGLDAGGGTDGEAIPLDEPGLAALRPRLRFGEATKPRDVETDPSWYNARKARCVRDGRFKYIETPYVWTEELYDLADDPAERRDVLADEVEDTTARGETPDATSRFEVEELRNGLRRELHEWSASADPLPSHFDSSQMDETIERLRSLGYLQ